MSIASPTTTTVTNASPAAANPLTSLFHSITKKRSLSPAVERFVKLCVQNPNKTNNSSSSTINREHSEKLIRNLMKRLAKSKRSGSIDELERAIVHNDCRTKCVTITR